MLRDHQPLTVADPRGLFDRGEDESTPRDHFLTSQNNRFITGGVKTREGSSSVHTISAVRRMAIYKRIGEAQRLLILDGAGHLYDSTNLSAPILTIVGMTDFSAETIFNRSYITPHNGVTGLPGEVVYVYNGSGTARAAAGVAPTGFTLSLADSSLSGNVEAGVRLVGVAFETPSGYITAPGGFQQITTVGGRRLNVGNLPIGPAGTAARVLVATQTLTSFNGDFVHQTYFTVPNGRVAGNVAIVLNDVLSFYDADLTDDVTFLQEQMETIPAGVGILLYNGRMITWGEDASPSLIRVSSVGEPESISDIEGFVTVNPGDSGNGLKNCWEFNKQLVCQKSQRTYFTQDNGDVASTWAVSGPLDSSIGTECHGVAKILDYGRVLENVVLTAHHTGIRVFNGTFILTPLTYNIDDVWSRVNKKAFNTVEIVINPLDTEIYVVVPLDGAATPNYILYANYNEGMTADKIKWDIWKLPMSPMTIVADYDTTVNEAVIKFGALSGNVYKFDTAMLTDFTTAIDAWVEYALLPTDGSENVNHFAGFRARVKGSGIITASAKGLDGVDKATFDSLGALTIDKVMALAPGKPWTQGMQLTTERASVKLRVNTANSYYTITKFSLYTAELWESR